MKKAFTMIELIFVIIILGILAAVAIPKLAATRTDSQTAVLVEQCQDATKEIISYYTSQGEEINFSKISSSSQIVFNELVHKKWVDIIDDDHALFYSNRNKKLVCITYTTDGVQIEVDTNSSNNDIICKSIKKFVKDHNITILNKSVNF